VANSIDPWPEWSKEPFNRFLDYVQSEVRLVELATNGIRMVVNQARLSEALYGLDVLDQPKRRAASKLADALVGAEMARQEVEADFPLLHAHSLVGVWGALEALINDVAVAWLTHRKALLKNVEFTAVKVPLGDFQRMSPAERIEYLLDQVPRPSGVPGGLPRFELLLDRVGLGGTLEDELRRTLIEVHQVRNVYAHRGGIADRKARAACPWRRDWKLGKPILVNHAEYDRYLGAIHSYAFELIVRSAAQFGVDAGARAESRGPSFSESERKKRRTARRRLLAGARRRMAAEEKANEATKAARTSDRLER